MLAPLTENDLEQSVPSRFHEVVAQYPDLTAIQTNDGTLTYEQLNRAANRIAHALLEKLGPGEEAVGLLFEHGASAVTAILGALKAGKFYVPLNPSAPIARNAQILAHSEARVLLTNALNLPEARLLADSTMRLNELNVDDLPVDRHEENPDLVVSPDSRSYLVYTSGSTGAPKGILNNHRNILHSTVIELATLGLAPEDHVALLFAYYFGASRTTTFATLLSGASLHPFDIKTEGLHNLFQWLADREITVLSTLPTVFRHLVEQAEAQPPLPHLRHMSMGGEAVTRRDVTLFRATFPAHCVLTNRFSSSETGRLTEFIVEPSTVIGSNIVPIGYPMVGKKVTITDADGNPVPAGMEGEITIQTRFLSPGYWRDPERTSKAFQPAPDGSGERIYKTGDLGLVRPDGCLMYQGRKDFQVKVRGQRVELAEVELALLEQGAVKEAVVVAHPVEDADVRLVAYVVPRKGHSITDSILLSAVSELLPGYMVPSAVVTLDELPLTATGKIDRLRLPLPEKQARQTSETYVPPVGALERRLVVIWEECLQVSPVGTEDKFLALGGNSITALQIFRRIEVELGKKLPLNVMLEAETIKDLVPEIRREDTLPPWPSLVPLQPNGSRPPLYVMHGGGGQIILYYRFARGLGDNQPVYGLRAQGLDGVTRPYISIEEMAAHYIREIRAIQPEGPYYLSGFSLGGKIAFEVACQLQAEGAPVALVAAIDTFVTPRFDGLPGNPEDPDNEVDTPESEEEEPEQGERAKRHWQEIRQRSPLQAMGYIARLIGRLWYWQVAKRIQKIGSHPSGIDDPSISAERRVKIASFIAGNRHKFKPFDGSVVVIRSEAAKSSRSDPRPVWQEWVTGGVELIDVSGSHESMLLDPDVKVLTSKMSALLERLHAGTP